MQKTKTELLTIVSTIKKQFPLKRDDKNIPQKELGIAINELIDSVSSSISNPPFHIPGKIQIDEGFNGYPGKTMRKYSELENDLAELEKNINSM